MRETRSLPQKNQEDRGQSSKLDAVLYPSPKALADLLTERAASGRLIEYDPCGFVEQLLCSEHDKRAIGIKITEYSKSIFCHILIEGLPRNAQANDALKELFSPVLLRQAIWRSLERSHTGQLTHELVALCFVFNPKETLQEINFLKFQPYKSRGNASVWSETAKGLIQGCLIKPSLWANLEPRQRSIINGPDIVANYLKRVDFIELIKLPAPIVKAAFRIRTPPSELEVSSHCSTIAQHLHSILEAPGLLPVLGYLRVVGNGLPETLINSVIAATLRAEGGYSGGLNALNWELYEKNGEPRKEREQASSICQQFIESATKWDEFRKCWRNYADSDDKQKRERALDATSSEVEKVLTSSSKFTQAEILSVLEHIESYHELHDLERIRDLAHCLLNKKEYTLSSTPLTLEEIAILFASRKTAPQHLLVNTLIRSDLRDITCRDALISVLFRNADPPESARALQDPRIGPIEFSIPCLANWEHLPKELDRLLYKSILAFGTSILGDYQEIAAALRRWEPDIEIKLPKDQVLKLEYKPKKELISGLIYALTKIRDPEESFVKWRDAFLEEFISVTGPSIFKYDRSLKESMEFIYRNSPVRALERLDNNSSEFSYRAALKLSAQELESLSPEHAALAKTINLSLARHLSSLTLESAPFVYCHELFFKNWPNPQKVAFSAAILERKHGGAKDTARRKLLKAIRIISGASEKGATLEQLRRRLAKKDLIRYSKQEINPVGAASFYLTKYGMEPPIEFAALSLVKKVLRNKNEPNSPIRPPIDDLAAAPKRLRFAKREELQYVIARPAGELRRVLDQYAQILKEELPLPNRLTVSKVVTGLPAERDAFKKVLMQRKWWAAGALLAAPAVAYGSRQIWLSNSLRGDLGSNPDSNEGLLPNGRIPSGGKIIAKLSEPLAYRHQAYLMHTLVGADRSGASQPPLSYPGSKELYKLISDCGQRAANSWQIDITINQVKKGTFIGMPIGAQIIDPTTTIVKNKDGRFVALKDAKDLTLSLRIPESPPQLLDAEASVIRNRLGPKHITLSKPRLPFSVIEELNPQLAMDIEIARKKPAHEAALYLRDKVRAMIRYEASPDYNQFSGSFREYLRLIFKNGRGICGQFACIYDEALKHAGIPSAIISATVPENDGVSYMSNGGHATNLVFLLSSDGKIAPIIMDATGVSSEDELAAAAPHDEVSFNDLKIPPTLAVTTGVLGGFLAAFFKRRSLVRQQEILARLQPDSHIHLEVGPPSSEKKQVSGDLTGKSDKVRASDRTSALLKSELLARWENSLNLNQNEKELAPQSASKSFFELDLFDSALDNLLKNQSEAIIIRSRTVEHSCKILEGVGIEPNREIVTIIDLWIQAMNDPEYRAKWIESLSKLRRGEAKALGNFAGDLFPELRDRFKNQSIISRLSSTAPITEKLLCKTLVPLGD